MSVQELQTAITLLPQEDLWAFARWFEEYQAQREAPEEEITAEWKAEIVRRAIEIEEGRVTLIEGGGVSEAAAGNLNEAPAHELRFPNASQ